MASGALEPHGAAFTDFFGPGEIDFKRQIQKTNSGGTFQKFFRFDFVRTAYICVLSGLNSAMFLCWTTGMALGGGASSPVAKEGPLSSGGLFHFPV
jgi:hypothetical protein